MKIIAFISILPILASCATASDEVREAFNRPFPYCNGTKATKSVIFILETYERPIRGIKLADFEKESIVSNLALSFYKRHLINSFSTIAPNGLTNVGHSQSDNQYEYTYNERVPPIFESNEGRNVELFLLNDKSPFRIAACLKDQCNDLKSRDGIPLSGYEQSNGLINIIKATGFNLGNFYQSHYFVSPKPQRSELCAMSGLPKNCFEATYEKTCCAKSDTREQCIQKSNSSAVCSVKFDSGFFEGSEVGHDLGQKKNLFEKRFDFENKMTFALALSYGTKISTKNIGDWAITQIHFNPNKVCEYARDANELYSE